MKALSHPQVVRLIASGRDETRGQHYIAMEWLERDLLGYLKDLGADAIKWRNFAPLYLRPLLEGLAAAHARRLIHRDIKPSNLMVAADGTVKLTDFGISKLLDSLRPGMTVSDFRSRPYAAPERESNGLGPRSDLYSLGVTAIDILGGVDARPPADADPRQLLSALSLPDDAQHFLATLIETDPERRPFSAKLALTNLNRILAWEREPDSAAHRPVLHVVLTQGALQRARAVLGATSESDAKKRLIADLGDREGPPSIGVDERKEFVWEEASIPLSLIGSELIYSGRFDRHQSGAVFISSVAAVPSSLLERRRDGSIELHHQLKFTGRSASQREDADQLLLALSERRAERAEQSLGRAESELLDRWFGILKAKSELESRREEPLPYRSWSREDRLVTFEVSGQVDERYLDQIRRIPIPTGGAVVGQVVEAGEGGIGIAVERGHIDGLPDRAQLLIDRGPSRRAIQRQKQALNALQDSSAARSDLARLLTDPERAEPLVRHPPGPFRRELDAPKQEAVEVALASPDFTLVQGPPGTGKTTFIVELIAQLLTIRPEARVLLSSQTHVAVDHAVTKLAETTDLRIVRLGTPERIAAAAEPLTVPHQLRLWRAEVSKRVKAWIQDWGLGRGISSEALGAYATAAAFRVGQRQIHRLRKQISGLEEEVVEQLRQVADPKREAPSPTSTGEMVSDVEDDLAAAQDELELRGEELHQLVVSHEKNVARLAEQLGTSTSPVVSEIDQRLRERFPVDPEDLERYESLAQLQDEWLARFGQSKDFTDALIARAQVVAGTCVGLAGILGEDDSFDLAIVDEVSKATPTEALVPMVRSKRWVLVGDEQQLPPFVDASLIDEGLLEANGLRRSDLEETLFSQLASLPGDRRLTLSRQHRMLKPIGDLISACFYENGLESSRGSGSERASLAATFPDPVTWYSTRELPGKSEQKVQTTYWNEAEVKEIRRLVTRLQGNAAEAGEHLQVGVITGYGEQVRRLRRDLRPDDPRWANLDLHVHPVDSFQGQERDVVIYSVTRCNERNDLGFLRSERRINVALSRARDALVIVGDDRFCSRAADGDNPFAVVLRHINRSPGCRLEVLGG